MLAYEHTCQVLLTFRGPPFLLSPYLYFQSISRICFSLSVYKRQKYAEDSQQTVYFVLLICCRASGRPAHSFRYAKLRESLLASKSTNRHFSDIVDLLLQRYPTTQPLALLGEKLNGGRRQKLLQRPASRVPPAPSKCFHLCYPEVLGVGDLG
jgi:hypothetical protein